MGIPVLSARIHRKDDGVVKTVNITTDIPASRELRITLPPDVPLGPSDIVVVVSSPGVANGRTLGDFADSEFFGMWRDRSDITDSVHFARGLRSEGWKRFA
jgi:hypothetical protein